MKNWYNHQSSEVLSKLSSNKDRGLSSSQAEKLQENHGKNEFERPPKDSIAKTILHQFKDISTIILLFAVVLSFALAVKEGHGFLEPFVILSIVILNIVLAITQERSAEKSLDALINMNNPTCKVLRDGTQQQFDRAECVPGDIVLLRAGDLVPADGRLFESVDLAIDESSLTGESLPVEKDAAVVLEDKALLGDQVNMVFSGSLVTGGNGRFVVTETGMQTQMGKIAGYLNNTQKLKTPLQLRLDKIGKMISFIAVISAVILFIVGHLQGEGFWTLILMAVSLAVAAVPETLSLIVTFSLSNGVKNMVTKNAIIRKLSAVETLGSTSVICSDKTGTLTQNKMTVQKLWVKGGDPLAASTAFSQKELLFLDRLVLVSNAIIEDDGDGKTRVIGDPTESAILRLFAKKGQLQERLAASWPRVHEIPFSSSRKRMTTIHQNPDGGYLVLSKGAFDWMPLGDTEGEALKAARAIHDSFAGDALRVIALASKRIDTLPDDAELEAVESELELEGLIGIIDPPREESARAIRAARRAGIRTVMITGDHVATASAIAREIGILAEGQKVLTGQELSEMSDEELCDSIREYSVFARVTPEDKIRIVEAWQENDEVVAMTGDGVNDAPALKAADVGVAMGQNGTEVAKSAADMVLADDNFATIVDAVHEGRNVFSNIRKTIYFLLVCNISEIIVMLGAQLMGWGFPVTPVMLLLINVLGDGIPGLCLAKERSDPRIMERKPIGRFESFFNQSLIHVIINQTIVCALVVLAGYYIGTNQTVSGSVAPAHLVGQTMSFLILGWSSILHVFNVRSRKSIFRVSVLDNRPILISAGAMTALFTVFVLVPPVGHLFGITPIGGAHWLIAFVLALVPTASAEIGKVIDNFDDRRAYRRRLVKHRVQD